MMGNRQSQKSGDSSVNIQAQGDVKLGLTYSETREVAMDTFKAEFVQFRNEAFGLVVERAETLVNSFLEQARKEGLSNIPEGRNPDFQYALYSAQRDYARSGDESLGELLVQLLVDRTKTKQRDLMQIVLNESLLVVPKLTPDQLDALALIFVLKYADLSRIKSFTDLHRWLDKFVIPFAVGASRKQSSYQHLEYVGCAVNAAIVTDAHEPFIKRYPGLFTRGFPRAYGLEYLNLTPEQIARLFIPARHAPLDPSRPEIEGIQIDAIDEESEDELIERLGVDPGRCRG